MRVNQIPDPAEEDLLVFILTKLTRNVKGLPMEDVEAIATTTKPKMNVLKLAVVQVNIDFNLCILEILILKYELAKFTIYCTNS